MSRTILASLVCVCLPVLSAFADEEINRKSALFTSLDKDGDGILTAEEVGEEKSALFNRLVTLGDANKDQKLTKEEFLKALNPPPGTGANPAANPPGDRAPQFNLAGMIQRFDKNNDGKLTRDEIPEEARERFNPFFERIGKDEISVEDFEAMRPPMSREGRTIATAGLMERFDQNKDGLLTINEVPEPMREHIQQTLTRLEKESLTPEEFSTAMAGFFRDRAGNAPPRRDDANNPRPEGRMRGPLFLIRLDTDQDGKLSKQELAMAAYTFDELDRNRDGQLDVQELMGPPQEGDRPRMDDMRRPDPNRPQRPGEPNANRPGNAPNGPGFSTRFWERFDTDKDGFLSKSELPEGRLADGFEKMDADADGKVSRDEFDKTMRERLSRD